MKNKTERYTGFEFEINRVRFKVEPRLTGEAEHGEFGGMPLPHYIYHVTVTRIGAPETAPVGIDYHGGFEEWARGRPYMPQIRALSIFADFVIDAALSVTRTPEDLLAAWAMDTDMANKTWRTFNYRRELLSQNFRMTTDQIVAIGNAFHVLMVNGKLADLLDNGKGVGRDE